MPPFFARTLSGSSLPTTELTAAVILKKRLYDTVFRPKTGSNAFFCNPKASFVD